MEWIVEAESLSDLVDHGRYTITSKPLVRCKDCKHGKYDIFDRGMWCELHPSLDVTEEDFCSFGERRTNETD